MSDIYGKRIKLRDMKERVTWGKQPIRDSITLYPCLRVGFGANGGSKRVWAIKTEEICADEYNRQWKWTYYDAPIYHHCGFVDAKHPEIWRCNDEPVLESNCQPVVLELREKDKNGSYKSSN